MVMSKSSVKTRPLNTRTYEQCLAEDARWALDEGSRYFSSDSDVHSALRKICKLFHDLNIPYAVSGGLALFAHGYRRFTEDVDILTTKAGLRAIHKNLHGKGYLPPFTQSKNLRDTELGVRIEFLVTGQYPGDGEEKPLAFPDPIKAAFEKDGILYLKLNTLVELKLASGISGADRIKDLADVQELIKILNLPEDYSDKLHSYVRDKYAEIWSMVNKPRRFLTLWRNKFLTIDAHSIDEMIDTLGDAAETLRAMRDAGVMLDPGGGTADDYAYLVTTDPDVARKFDMHDESEFWGEDLEGLDTEESDE